MYRNSRSEGDCINPKHLLRETITYDCSNMNDIRENLDYFNSWYNKHNDWDPWSIAVIITELWSEEMYDWAELVFHRYAKGRYYLTPEQLRVLHAQQGRILNENFKYNIFYTNKVNQETPLSCSDVIRLLMEDFKMELYLEKLALHMRCVELIFSEIFKDSILIGELNRDVFINDLQQLLENQNLDKFSLRRAIAYTLMYVHGIDKLFIYVQRRHIEESPHRKENWPNKTMPLIYLYQCFINKLAYENEKTIPTPLLTKKLLIEKKWFDQFNTKEKEILYNLIDAVNENSEYKITKIR